MGNKEYRNPKIQREQKFRDRQDAEVRYRKKSLQYQEWAVYLLLVIAMIVAGIYVRIIFSP